ncbi:MAG: hypothetical protein AAF485_21570 [Chloroflexota bacterium]
MSDDWLDQLQQIRDEDQAEHDAVTRKKQAKVEQHNKALDLLRKYHVHELLRQIQKTLLSGHGTLDIFDIPHKYERVITLSWQGPVSAARKPATKDDEPYNYIMVGVRQGHLWINDKKIKKPNEQTIKAALLEACRKPKREKKG